jgi:hypothetical protein
MVNLPYSEIMFLILSDYQHRATMQYQKTLYHEIKTPLLY